MEAVQALFEEDLEDDAPLCGGNKSASRAQTLTSMTTAVPMINFKERELTSAERNNVQTKIKDLKMKGRLMADSALTTYFGKPAFHAYGNGNLQPGQGGLIYGDYMKTHSINPHSGDNKPER
jgi:hypothetical protein